MNDKRETAESIELRIYLTRLRDQMAANLMANMAEAAAACESDEERVDFCEFAWAMADLMIRVRYRRYGPTPPGDMKNGQ